MHVKSALSSAAVLLVAAASLAACRPGSATSASSAPATGRTGSSSAPVNAAAPTSPPTSSPSAPAGTATKGSGGSGGPTAPGGGTGHATGSAKGKSVAAKPSSGRSSAGSGDTYVIDDSYAWKHPCSSKQISVHVVRRAPVPTQRVIEVRNNGPRSCGLSYYPHVVLLNGESATGGVTITPLVPDGLGGAPAFAVYAGTTAYAVIDLDPGGATTGTASGVDQMNVLADGDHMSSRETLPFPLGSGAHVLKPKLGLYRLDLRDAVTSMEAANIQP